jgi:glycosyltransferase involved in cell wall biosynthesis
MRVLHVSQPTDGGVAAVVRSLIEDQLTRGWGVMLACPAGPLREDVEALGAEVRTWRAERAPHRGLVAEIASLRRIIEDFRPDVVHLHSSKAGLSGRLAVRKRIPTLFQPHGWSFNTVGTPVRAASAWERVAAAWTDLLICVSDGELLDGRRRGIRPPNVVVPNGVDLERFRPSDRGAARYSLRLDTAAPVAVCIGRLSAEKGQDLLLRAWPAVLASVPDARLLVVGDGPCKLQWQGTVPGADHRSVTWVPQTDQPQRYIAAADVVVLPSRTEGMALVPLEAMACGRSVVAFDVGGARHTLGKAGCGALVPPQDVPGLASAVATRLADRSLADAEGRAGRRRAEVMFDIRTSAAAVARATERIRQESLGVQVRCR